MSASLVGSEMCIRDRDSGQQRNGRAGAVARGTAPDSLLRLGAGLRLWTVSYTHLTLPTICSV
eukprot:4262557-Alexandrium_andersonii.AAC.1